MGLGVLPLDTSNLTHLASRYGSTIPVSTRSESLSIDATMTCTRCRGLGSTGLAVSRDHGLLLMITHICLDGTDSDMGGPRLAGLFLGFICGNTAVTTTTIISAASAASTTSSTPTPASTIATATATAAAIGSNMNMIAFLEHICPAPWSELVHLFLGEAPHHIGNVNPEEQVNTTINLNVGKVSHASSNSTTRVRFGNVTAPTSCWVWRGLEEFG